MTQQIDVLVGQLSRWGLIHDGVPDALQQRAQEYRVDVRLLSALDTDWRRSDLWPWAPPPGEALIAFVEDIMAKWDREGAMPECEYRAVLKLLEEIGDA